MEYPIKKKLDNLYIGIAIGIIVPALIYFLQYRYNVRAFNALSRVMHNTDSVPAYVSRVLMLCFLSDAPLFFLSYWLKLDKIAKGILIIAAISVVIMLGLTLYSNL